MSALRLVSASALVLALAACSPEVEIEEIGAGDTTIADPAGTDVIAASDTAPAEEETLEPLVIAARQACAAGDEGFVDQIADGTGFVSRGPDARVHAAWQLDGESGEYIISTPALAMDDRMAFDFAVADFMRHNMVAGFDRTGITGAFRHRDGRFCVVQTEREVIEALRDATLTAAARL